MAVVQVLAVRQEMAGPVTFPAGNRKLLVR